LINKEKEKKVAKKEEVQKKKAEIEKTAEATLGPSILSYMREELQEIFDFDPNL
jgi:hypothetical protein